MLRTHARCELGRGSSFGSLPPAAARADGGFLAHLEAWAEFRDVPYQGVPVGTIIIDNCPLSQRLNSFRNFCILRCSHFVRFIPPLLRGANKPDNSCAYDTPVLMP